MAARAFVPLQTDEAGNPVAEQPIVPIADQAHSLYGRVTITAADCQRFADDFNSLPVAAGGERELPIYRQHDPNAGAMGWLRGVRVDPQRGLIGRMVFNEAGTQAVKDQQFPYLSPELSFPPNRKLTGLSLVVKPFFREGLPKVQLFTDPSDLAAGEQPDELGILVFGDPEDLGLSSQLPQQAGATLVAPNPRNADPSLAQVPGSGASAQAASDPATAGQQFGESERVMNLEREVAELRRRDRVQTFADELGRMTFGDPEHPQVLAPAVRGDLAEALADAPETVAHRIAGLLGTMRFYEPGERGFNDRRTTTRALTPEEQVVCDQLGMTRDEFLAGGEA